MKTIAVVGDRFSWFKFIKDNKPSTGYSRLRDRLLTDDAKHIWVDVNFIEKCAGLHVDDVIVLNPYIVSSDHQEIIDSWRKRV